eukprot:COSAG02_NODE_2053_length_9994_cov_7.402628_12_plen_100_part_00
MSLLLASNFADIFSTSLSTFALSLSRDAFTSVRSFRPVSSDSILACFIVASMLSDSSFICPSHFRSSSTIRLTRSFPTWVIFWAKRSRSASWLTLTSPS